MRERLCVFACLICGTSQVANALEPMKIGLECAVTGMKVSGEVSNKPFKERFLIEKSEIPYKNKDGKAQNWGVTKTEFYSNGEKYDATAIAITPEHIVTSYANVVGSGYKRHLVVFTHIIDLKALDVDRVVTTVPKSSDERTHAMCKSTS